MLCILYCRRAPAASYDNVDFPHYILAAVRCALTPETRLNKNAGNNQQKSKTLAKQHNELVDMMYSNKTYNLPCRYPDG